MHPFLLSLANDAPSAAVYTFAPIATLSFAGVGATFPGLPSLSSLGLTLATPTYCPMTMYYVRGRRRAVRELPIPVDYLGQQRTFAMYVDVSGDQSTQYRREAVFLLSAILCSYTERHNSIVSVKCELGYRGTLTIQRYS